MAEASLGPFPSSKSAGQYFFEVGSSAGTKISPVLLAFYFVADTLQRRRRHICIQDSVQFISWLAKELQGSDLGPHKWAKPRRAV